MQNHYQRKKYTKPNLSTETSWKTIFFRNSGGFSSKRIISLLCVLVCLVVFVIGFIKGKEIPEFGETIFIGALSLYGVEAIPNIWTKTINKS